MPSQLLDSASVPPAPRPGSPPYAGSGLHARLKYLTAFRLAIMTALLGATTWLAVSRGSDFDATLGALLYGLISFVYAASLAYLWVLKRYPRRPLTGLAYAQVAGDVFVATFLVYLTGGADSLFTLMYPLAIVNAAILLDRYGTVVAGLGAAACFALLTAGLTLAWIEPPAPYLAQRPLEPLRFAFVVLANSAAFVLTAALASYLTAQLRTAGERLNEREIDYAALAELHASIVRSMTSGIMTTDLLGRVTFLNPAAEEMLGVSMGELLDRPLRTRFPAFGAAIEQHLGRPPNERGEVDEQDGQGRRRRLGFAVNVLKRGERVRSRRVQPGVAVVFQDLTPLVDMQERVRRADRLAAVGQLAAGLAHELRNPLASMTGALELMARGPNLSTSEQRLADIVRREAERLNVLVTDFMTFARPAPVVLADTDLAALADDTLRMFRVGPLAGGLDVERTGARRLVVPADAGQVKQVLWNLLKNASEAMDGQGRLVVDVSTGPEGGARLSVTDSGPGLTAEQRAHLFEPFFTTKAAGTGLGLAWVHRIVEAHGGHIEARDASPGVTFAVWLPGAAAREQESGGPSGAQQARTRA